MKRSFSTREKILIFIAAVMAVGIFYYEVVYKPVISSVAAYDTSVLQDQLEVAQVRAQQEVQMKKAIEDASSTTQTGKVAVYNNQANEVNALGTILNGSAENVSISWSSPTLTDTTVRRQATISFKAADYTTARSLIKQINDMAYRNVISTVSLANSKDSTSSSTTVTLTMTFFETTNGAASTQGLVKVDSTATASTTK